MLGILSLGVCIACISCLCCLCTATVVAVPGLMDLHADFLMSGKRQCDEARRESNESFSSNVKKIISSRKEATSEETESEACPCTMTYVLDPILQSRYSSGACTNGTRKRKTCKCPSFLDLVGDPPKTPAKFFPRS